MDNEQPRRVTEQNFTLDWPRIDSERLHALKKVRGARKGLVTKIHIEIRDLMLDSSNVDVVKRKVQELKKILDALNGAHGAYHNQLTEERDIVESDEYLKAVNQSVTDLANGIQAGWSLKSLHYLNYISLHARNRLSPWTLLATSVQKFLVVQSSVQFKGISFQFCLGHESEGCCKKSSFTGRNCQSWVLPSYTKGAVKFTTKEEGFGASNGDR